MEPVLYPDYKVLRKLLPPSTHRLHRNKSAVKISCCIQLNFPGLLQGFTLGELATDRFSETDLAS